VNALKHSLLSASASERWLNCPRSVAMTRGMDSGDTIYSQEGTAAHLVQQRCLTENLEPRSFIGEVIEGIPVTAEMADAVAISVSHCRRQIDTADAYWIEQSINLAKLGPPVPMHGTLDFGAYFAKQRELHLVDFKYGRGVYVRATGNAQLKYYGLAAALTFDIPVSAVVTTIIQPRFGGTSDPIRSAVVDAAEMAEFALVLLERAHAAMRPDAPIAAGSWCKFCQAKNTCQTHQLFQHAEVYREFALAT
jgi:Protein of unknown function (DUF2800)